MKSSEEELLEARAKVLSPDEIDLWRGITSDLMSDEEEDTSEGVSVRIVRPPYFRSQELSDLCAKLQARLQDNPKYMATHRRRLSIGSCSDRLPSSWYDPEAAKRHLSYQTPLN
ncbi:uncharacterized protein C14orf93-like [Hoplias malabaricus]|uniref:uncharacterized protein C14orf93-like n=1 Tax=Hoplias malabaricus TaxID=27720 RepID=UPI0034637AEE